MLFLGVGGSGIAYLLYYFMMNTLGATRATTVTFLLPVTAVLLGRDAAPRVDHHSDPRRHGRDLARGLFDQPAAPTKGIGDDPGPRRSLNLI